MARRVIDLLRAAWERLGGSWRVRAFYVAACALAVLVALLFDPDAGLLLLAAAFITRATWVNADFTGAK
ncbi:hypothetical protein [Alteraurantiacibacter buctensis]|uniref:Uncharacterized protein n=1 Tax=Alteraurantiacibacter buctensis TaxID=1503981 RepID=A0A844YVJ7_9SPHN|nr:hypothetical protein [Alteraurantiacibacter buctensis]MXO72365.1 hypothetical protein [Alteraurantiacibacter buctensis]